MSPAEAGFGRGLFQVDAIRAALNWMSFKEIEIVIAETGWPYKGDSNEVGPSIENAKAYNGNLISHLRSMVGTPLMPGKSVDTYLFALYDEDLKPGPGSERAFGLFKPDLTMTYDVGLSKGSQVRVQSNEVNLGSVKAKKILSVFKEKNIEINYYIKFVFLFLLTFKN